jgi:hypothetical protein
MYGGPVARYIFRKEEKFVLIMVALRFVTIVACEKQDAKFVSGTNSKVLYQRT